MQERFARWPILFLQYLRRDRGKIPLWVLGLGLFSAGLVPVFEEMAQEDGLLGMYAALKNPAMISMVGPTPIERAADYTLGAMYAQEMLLFCGLFAMALTILHVVGQTRKAEDLGLMELVRSFQVGRQANSLALAVEVLAINTLLAVFIGGVLAGFAAETISTNGSFLFGAAVGLAGLLGGAIALFAAQIMPASSGAAGASLGVMGLFYILRGGTDVTNPHLSMFNPLGWIYLTHPFTVNNWLPIGLGLIFSALLTIAAFGLEGARDLGAGYLPTGTGRANAKRSLLSAPGLFLRLNKGVIIGWLLAFLILGAAYGTIYGDMEAFLETNEMMKRMFTSAGFTLEESFTSTLMAVMAALVAILPIAVVNSLFTEERHLYLSQILGTKVRRSHLYWANLAIAIVPSLLGMFLATGGLGLSALTVMDKGSLSLLDFLAAGYSLYPTVLFFTGLAALALGWLPQLGKLVYVYLGYSFFLNYFQGLLGLPNWLVKTAPQSWLPQMPVEGFNLRIFLSMAFFSLILMAMGCFGYCRRDLLEGA